jgi:hypothetical protein
MSEVNAARSTEAATVERLRVPRPVYVVVCPLRGDLADVYEPTVFERGPGDAEGASFDPALTPALPAIWYALHLPKTRFEVLDLSLSALRDSLTESRRHQVLLMAPAHLADPQLLAWLTTIGEPTLVLCPDDQFRTALAATEAGGFVLPPTRISDFSQSRLDSHWARLGEHWASGWPPGAVTAPSAPRWTPDISTLGSELPTRRLRRHLGLASSPTEPSDRTLGETTDVLSYRAWLEAWADLEEREVPGAEAERALPSALKDARDRLRVPLAVSLPGVAPRYRRLVRRLPEVGTDHEAVAPRRHDSARPVGDPPEVLSLMIAHQASGSDSMGLVVQDQIPDDAFVALADLERLWAEAAGRGRRPRPDKEARLRARLDEAARSLWTGALPTAVGRASRIDAYTNFPIGLLRPPGLEVPLAAVVPIAYRPINPLTRALQVEFNPDEVVDLSDGMSVLVVECIPSDDRVGRISRGAWTETAGSLADPSRRVFMRVVSAADSTELAEAVASHRPDVLVISAHGAYDPDSNGAGLMIGDSFSLGDDLGPMPAMVILSSCHSGPRGAGPVSVCDLLLRSGARAVLSTLVPVDVRHNSIFMSRFLHYMSECIVGTEDHADVLDLWHRVQTNTVVIDILHGNPRLSAWGHSRDYGEAPIVEFMRTRSRGRIRSTHLYEDAEAVLLGIAEERGQLSAVTSWLRDPGYLPESMMYTFVGDPSLIRLQRPGLVERVTRAT